MSPRTSAKNEEIRQESMQNIMDVSFRLIAKHGYESTSIAQIAKEAGVSKGLLYNYFDSKEDLLEKLVLGAMKEADKLIETMVDADPAITLRNLFQWFFKEMRERPEHWKLITELTFKIEKFEFIQKFLGEKIVGYMKFMQSLLEQLGFKDPEGEAMLLTALFDGIGIQYLVVHENYPMDKIEAFLIKKYCTRKQK